MWGAERKQFVQPTRPTLSGLVGQPGDQVHVDVVETAVTQTRDFVDHDRTIVQSSDRLRFLIDERLNAQTHAVHARVEQSIDQRIRQRARGALDGDLGVGSYYELATQRTEDAQ